MPRQLIAATVLLLSVSVSGCRSKQDEPDAKDAANMSYIDLQPYANQQLSEPFGRGAAGNDLSDLPQGEQSLGPATFRIESGLIHLGSSRMPGKPLAVEGIEVNLPVKRLYVLHGTGSSGAGPGRQGVGDGTQIGEYLIHYADGETAVFPIVYGQHLRDWWNWDNLKPALHAEVAWLGTNDSASKNNVQLRLYAARWKNPYPEKPVATIDYISNGTTSCTPFCVAMTAEQ